MALIFLSGMVVLLLFNRSQVFLRRRRDRGCVLPITAEVVSVLNIKRVSEDSSEMTVTMRMQTPGGEVFEKPFTMVFEGENRLLAGAPFPAYVDPNDYSHFVLIPPTGRQAVAI